jgi:hypothetical protein
MPKHETRPALEHHSHHAKEYILYHRILYTHLLKYCIVIKANLDNYDGLKDHKKAHIKYQKYLRTSDDKKRHHV